ncbi:hypothetical protein [Bradyrhizobium pachyrhizi]|nr:hypothetical protein [Bradyrhizobium pachyrhizi]
MNDDIVDAAKKHFASNYFEARERFRSYVAEVLVGKTAVYP